MVATNNLQIPSSLRQMEFDGTLHSHAFEISSVDLRQLRDLNILRLIHFQGLKKLPEDLGDLLNGLLELSLSYCRSVKELPGHFKNSIFKSNQHGALFKFKGIA